MIVSEIIGIEESNGQITFILDEKTLSDAAWDNVINGESIDDQTDFVNRRYTPIFQSGLDDSLVGKTLCVFEKNGAKHELYMAHVERQGRKKL